MLSEEEKKAIERFKANANYCITSKETTKIILNLIEKQQKEIEELKQNIHLKEVYVLKTNDYIKGTNDAHELCNKMWEDKLKAKIEEYEKELNKLLQKEEWLEPHDTIKRNKYMHYIEFGQSLLEKE